METKIEKQVQTGRRVQIHLNPGWCFTNPLPGNAGPLHYMIFDSETAAAAAVAAAVKCSCDYCQVMPQLMALGAK